MREIKFRVWNGEKITTLSNAMLNTLVGYQHNNESNELESFYENVILMQYTGLKDCEGKEIYEGDIIQAKNRAKGYYVIEFKDGGFKRKFEFNMKYEGEELISIRYLENIYSSSHRIVGNIYENHELLIKED